MILYIEVKEYFGALKKFEKDELEALFDEDTCQTQGELAESLKVDQTTFTKCLKAFEMIQKQGKCVQYELKSRHVERRFCTCKQLLQQKKRNSFMHRIVTVDKNWIYYDNAKIVK